MGGDSCAYRTFSAGAFGAAVGTVYGAVAAVWSADTGAVVGSRALPALLRTGGVIGASMGTLGAVGAAYAGMECLVESIRGKEDFWNGVAGGFASGAVVAVRSGNPSVMFFTGAALAAVSAATDATGRSLRGGEGITDGATPVRHRSTYPL